MALILFKKEHFLHFCAGVSEKSKSTKAIYIYASERSRYTFSENGIVYYAMTYCFGDISLKFEKLVFSFEKLCYISAKSTSSLIFQSLVLTVAQTPINHIIF